MNALDRLLRHRRLVLALFGLAVAAAAAGLPRLAIDNSPEAFFLHDAAAVERHRQLQMTFGRDRALRLVVDGPGLWSHDGLAWLGELERQANALGGVMGAGGLAVHHRDRPAGWPPADPERFRAEVLGDTFDREAGWVSLDGAAVTVLVVLYNLPPAREGHTLEELEKLLATAPPGVTGAMTGLPILQRAFDGQVVSWAVRFFPLLVLVAAVLPTLAFRGLAGALPPMAFVAVCQVPVFGTLGWLGVRVDMVSMILAPLLLVIPLATAVHVSVRFRQLLGVLEKGARAFAKPRSETTERDVEESVTLGEGARLAAVAETYREKGWPVLWTGVTTAAGLASLAASSVPSVRALGVEAGLGLAWMTFASFTFYPALLALGSGGVAAGVGAGMGFEVWARRRGRAWAAWAVRRRRLLALLFALAAVVALAGLPRLRQQSNFLTYLSPGHPVRARLEALQELGIGSVAADLVLGGGPVEGTSSPAPAAPFRSAAGLEALARLAARLRGEPRVLGVVSAGDLLASEVRWATGSAEGVETEPETVLARLWEEEEKGLLLATLVNREGTRARLSLALPMLGYEELEPLFERAEAAARQAFPGVTVWITGRYPLVLAAQRTLLRTFIASLSLTFLVVTVIFRLLVGRLARSGTRLTLAALAPNLWPVALVVGVMGWLRVPLDNSTVMVASVVLGLAVDDTLHTLGRFRRELEGRGPAEAVVATMERTAPAHVLTSALLVLGFGLCGLSAFVPVARFAALTAFALALALAADLLLVPALLAAGNGPPTPSGGAAGPGSSRPGSAVPAVPDRCR